MLRVWHVLRHWETRMQLHYGLLRMCSLLVMFLFAVHWVACGWIVVSFSVSVSESWVQRYAGGDLGKAYAIAVYWPVDRAVLPCRTHVV